MYYVILNWMSSNISFWQNILYKEYKNVLNNKDLNIIVKVYDMFKVWSEDEMSHYMSQMNFVFI